MSIDAGWLPDPTGTHQVRYWDGAAWTEHVSDGGTTAVDPLPADAPPPPPPVAAAAPPPPPPAAEGVPAASGKGGWKDKLKNAAQSAAAQGKQMAEQAKTTVAEQQSKRTEQWANDPNTVWFGASQSMGGVSKATYRITKDRVWIETGLLGTKSESVPLWSVKDLDVRQNLMQRGKDIGDVVLILEDASYGVDAGNTLSFSGMSEPGTTASGQVVLDNIEGPYNVRELLMPLISEARQKKLMERQSQFIHVNPGMQAAMGGVAPQAPPPPAAPAAPAAPAGPPVDLADQLRKLASLRDEGILSDEEFAAQKAKLLGELMAAEPTTELDARYGEEGVPPVPWEEAERVLSTAGVSWLSTVRADGQPHVTPLITAWHDGAVWITTGPHEQKARNLAGNARCTLTTGCNALHEGLDVVVEGTAVRETDEGRLRAVAAAFEAKYGEEWHFDVDGDVFRHGPGEAHVFRVAPVTAYGFGKAPYSHTRWRFDP